MLSLACQYGRRRLRTIETNFNLTQMSLSNPVLSTIPHCARNLDGELEDIYIFIRHPTVYWINITFWCCLLGEYWNSSVTYRAHMLSHPCYTSSTESVITTPSACDWVRSKCQRPGVSLVTSGFWSSWRKLRPNFYSLSMAIAFFVKNVHIIWPFLIKRQKTLND